MNFQPIWIALRAAVIGTAVYWAALNVVGKVGWHAPYGLTEPAVFFVVFFLGILMVK